MEKRLPQRNQTKKKVYRELCYVDIGDVSNEMTSLSILVGAVFLKNRSPDVCEV